MTPSHNPLFEKFVFYGIEGEFRIFFHIHFFHDACPVCADSLGAQAQFLGDFADGLAGGKHQHDLVFAV